MRSVKTYINYMINEGVSITAIELFNKVREIFYIQKVMSFYKLSLLEFDRDMIPLYKLSYTPDICELNKIDIDVIVSNSYQNETEISNRFSKGHRCFVIRINSDIAGYLWLTTHDEYVPEIDYVFSVPSRSIYLYNVRVKKEYRGKKIFLVLLSYVCEVIKNENYEFIYASVISKNIASLKGFERCGFSKYQYVVYKKLINKVKYQFHNA